MTQEILAFQYEVEDKPSGMTAMRGIAIVSGHDAADDSGIQ
jgi:hypothetical protein